MANHPSASQIVNVLPMRTKRDVLAVIAHVCIILFSVGYLVGQIRESLARAATTVVRPPEIGEIEEQAYTNALAAHFTFTNLNSFPAETCIRGVIREKNGTSKLAAFSAPVCTGEMKARSTVVLEAPYRVGEVEELCSGSPDRWGNTHLDWSKCSFTTEKVGKK
jgi:hypothetical protein